jgi:hypothetical protein
MMEKNEILDPPSENKKINKRPILVTLLCIALALGVLYDIPNFIFTANYAFRSGNYSLLFVPAIDMLMPISITGLWFMKKWAAIVQIILLILLISPILNVTMSLAGGILFASLIGIVIAYYKRMS